MARKAVNRYAAHQIPCVDVFRMSKSKIAQHGKYIIKIDSNWQLSTSDIREGFHEYISNPVDPQNNGLKNNSKANQVIHLKKKNFEFDGVLDYSLDLRHLIDYCESRRCIKTYFKYISEKNYCLALVKLNFEKDTKEIREFFYRPEGFNISYNIDGIETTINYVRYKRTASGAREGSCLFIAKDLYEHMNSWSNAGINPVIAKHIDSVSWEAYIALTLSSIETAITLDPRQFLFVQDKETIITQGKAFEITYDKDKDCLIQRNNIYSDVENNKTLTNKNKIWDGEGLIDNSLFTENEVLKQDAYSNKSMLLLRGKLFKACVFRTHIQKWFSDNGISDKTHKISDLNGYTQAEKISDIKFIIPYSCLKFLKFKNENASDEDLIKNWITDIAGKRTIPLFGIIKTDKKSKLMNGEKVFTTYQMLNTLGFDEEAALKFLQPTIDIMKKLADKDGANYVKYYLDNLYFSPSSSFNEYGDEISDSIDTFKIIHYQQLTASTILNYNTEYYNTNHFQNVVRSLLSHIKKQVIDGRVLIDGVYATLFCNGIELLKYAIDKNYDPNSNTAITVMINGNLQSLPLLKKNEIYSKRFSINSTLLCARNPHITMGNYYLAKNRKDVINKTCTENAYDRYFVLSNEIVCVNAIDSDIMNTLNGCDFDSDTMLITDNNIMVNLLRQQLRNNGYANKFRVPYNNVQSKTITPNSKESESIFLSNVDDKLSNNMIGKIINLSQRLNSLIWMLAPLKVQREEYGKSWNKWHAKIGKELYVEGCCTLAVLSNIEIDSAKRSYHCNTKKELKKIRNLLGKDYEKLKKYTSWLTKEKNVETITIIDDDTIMGMKIIGLDPMGYIINAIISAEIEIKKGIPKASLADNDFLRKLLEDNNIYDSDSDCEKSFNKCLNALISCFDYLDHQNIASKENRFFKRAYSKDCSQIINCCTFINNTLHKETASSNALLSRLIQLTLDSSRLIKTSADTCAYIVVEEASDEYQNTPKENRHDTPRALLWASIFLSFSKNNTYLTERL